MCIAFSKTIKKICAFYLRVWIFHATNNLGHWHHKELRLIRFELGWTRWQQISVQDWPKWHGKNELHRVTMAEVEFEMLWCWSSQLTTNYSQDYHFPLLDIEPENKSMDYAVAWNPDLVCKHIMLQSKRYMILTFSMQFQTGDIWSINFEMEFFLDDDGLKKIKIGFKVFDLIIWNEKNIKVIEKYCLRFSNSYQNINVSRTSRMDHTVMDRFQCYFSNKYTKRGL